MGIRYYAYAFDTDHTAAALADPSAFISGDPLADAWGFTPHARVATATFEQAVPKRDMLYLDKAWRPLQLLTGPVSPGAPARPAFRMFEGDVTMHVEGWIPWYRALPPEEMPEIARDLAALVEGEEVLDAARRSLVGADDDAYAREFLRRAREFVDGLVAAGRGMAYMIG